MYRIPEVSVMALVWQLGVALAEVAIVYLFFCNFFAKSKTSRLPPAVGVFVASIVIAAVQLLHISLLSASIVLLIYCLLALVLFEGKRGGKLQFSVVATAARMIAELGATAILPALLRLWPHAQVLPQGVAAPLIGRILFGVLVGALVLIFPHKYKLAQAPDAAWALGLPLLGVCGAYLLLQVKTEVTTGWLPTVLALMAVLLVVATIAPLLIYNSTYECSSRRGVLRLEAEREHANEVFSRAQARNLIEQQRRNRDFKNHLANLHKLYGKGTPEAEAYYASLVDSIDLQKAPCLVHVGNETVSDIISRVRAQCAQSGIRCDWNIECSGLAFLRLLDASAILDNAFDNAITACLEVKEAQKRYIKFSIREHPFFIGIRIENARINKICERDGVLLSTKSGTEQPGRGYESIKLSAAKYGGDISYKYDDESFTLHVRLGKARLPEKRKA